MKTTMQIFFLMLMLLAGRISFAETKMTEIQFENLDSENINFPIKFKYPQDWFLREENSQTPSIFVSREPVRAVDDTFKVGVSAMYLKNFLMKDATADAVIQGIPAEKVILLKEWDDVKNGFLNDMKAQGFKISYTEDYMISGRKAFRMDAEDSRVKEIAIFINDGAHMVLITAEAFPDEFSDYSEVFEEIIQSIEFKD